MKKHFILLCLLVSTASAQTLFLSDSNNDILYTVDPLTGAATAVGSTLPVTTPCGLAHSGASLYTLDLGSGGGLTGGLFTLNVTTGVPTGLGATGLNGWQDIAWDASTGQFFGVNQSDTLHSISTAGVATLVGSTPAVHLFTAIAVDNSGTLWGIDFSGGGALGTLDKTTGAFTIVQAATLAGIQGLAFHPVTNVLYASSTTTDSLYTIDVTTGAVTLVGPHGAGVGFAKGLTFEASACPVPEYQLNYPAATVTIDGLAATACSPAITTLAAGVAGTLAFSSVNVGLGYEAVIAASALIPASGGALVTANGQIFNVNLATPGLLFLIGGAAPSFAPFPGNFALGLVAPAGPLTLSIQMLVFDPVFPDGFVLSQGNQLNLP